MLNKKYHLQILNVLKYLNSSLNTKKSTDEYAINKETDKAASVWSAQGLDILESYAKN